MARSATPRPATRREGPGAHRRLDDPEYRSTRLRHPNQLLVYLPHQVTEIAGPQLGPARILGERDNDVTVHQETRSSGMTQSSTPCATLGLASG